MHCQEESKQSSKTASLCWSEFQNYKKAALKKYNKNSKTWQPVNLSQDQTKPISFQQQLSTLTLNVLTDSLWQAPLKRNILHSQTRYPYILEYLSSVQPHIITFNQVTQNFYRLLTACEWVKEGYWVSQFGHAQGEGSFNVVLARIEPVFLRAVRVTDLSREVLTLYFLLQNEGKEVLLVVTCAHLTSLTRNAKRRVKQLTQLTQLLQFPKTQPSPKTLQILQGDLNIHSQQQNPIFPSLGWQDSWLQFHSSPTQSQTQTQQQILSAHPGYTFDAEKNSLIKEVYWGFQGRRMRLDRVVYRGGLLCTGMQIVLDKPVYGAQGQGEEYRKMGWVKGTTALLGDLVGVNLFREKEKYLFPSDHFGLLCKFQINF